MLFEAGFPVVIAAVAVIMDLRSGRIDNGWLVFTALAGLCSCVLEHGICGIIKYTAGMLLPILLLCGLFWFHMLGAGDIKLFCVLGGLLGPLKVVSCIFFTLLLGACISMAILISNGDIRQRFHFFLLYLADFLKTGERKPYIQKGLANPENFHFTVPIFLSVVLYAGGIY